MNKYPVNSVELKIKSKHLAIEPKIIKFEESKIKEKAEFQRSRQRDISKFLSTLESLRTHRRFDVSIEARATYLARGYLRGMHVRSIENKRSKDKEYTFHKYIVPRVTKMINKYGYTSGIVVDINDVTDWVNQ